jgi:phosphoglucosamine mutase
MALQVLTEMLTTGCTLRELAGGMTKYPQQLTNVKLDNMSPGEIMESDLVKKAVREAVVEMGTTGNVLLRPSGTESLIRVMVESDYMNQVERFPEQITSAVREVLASWTGFVLTRMFYPGTR